MALSNGKRSKLNSKEREKLKDIESRHERARVRTESILAAKPKPSHGRQRRAVYDRALLDSLLIDLIPLYFAKFRTLGAVAKFLSAPSRATIAMLNRAIDEDIDPLTEEPMPDNKRVSPSRIAMMEATFEFASAVHESYGQSPDALQPYLMKFMMGHEFFGRPPNQPRLVSRTSIEKLIIDSPEFRDHMMDVYEEIIETLEERAWQRALHQAVLVDDNGDAIEDPRTKLPMVNPMSGDGEMLKFLLRANRPDKYRENNPQSTQVNVAFLQNGQPNPNYNPNAGGGAGGGKSGQKFIVAGQEVHF